MPLSFLTANDLRTGEVVYWTQDGVWSLDASHATLAHSEEAQQALEAVLQSPDIDLHVVGAYLVASHEQAEAKIAPNFPKKMRESRRIAGPSAGLPASSTPPTARATASALRPLSAQQEIA